MKQKKDNLNLDETAMASKLDFFQRVVMLICAKKPWNFQITWVISTLQKKIPRIYVSAKTSPPSRPWGTGLTLKS